MLTSVLITLVNLAALLEFSKDAGPNGLDLDSGASPFAEVVTLKIYINVFFPMLVYRKKSFWAHWHPMTDPENCNTTVWPLRKLTSKPGTLPGGLLSS